MKDSVVLNMVQNRRFILLSILICLMMELNSRLSILFMYTNLLVRRFKTFLETSKLPFRAAIVT